MDTTHHFVTKGILKYLSHSIILGAACVAVALPAQARTEHQSAGKAAVKSVATKTKARAGKDDDTVATKRVAAKGKARAAASKDDDEPAAKPVRNVRYTKNLNRAGAARDAEDDTPVRGAKVRQGVAGKAGKGEQAARRADDEDKAVPLHKGARKQAAAAARDDASPKGRKLTRAERAKAEHLAKAAAAEEARQQRLETSRKAREEEHRQQIAREKRQQEIARLERQQEQARQKRMAEAAARERALQEDRIATSLAERDSGVREMKPAAMLAAAAVPAVVAAAAVTAPTLQTPVASVQAAPARDAAPVVHAGSPVANALIASTPQDYKQPQGYVPSKSSPVANALIAPMNEPAPVRVAAAPAVTRLAPATVANKPEIVRVSVPATNRLGEIRGMHLGVAPVLNSAVAFVMDQNTGEVLLNKNGSMTTPIASITKLMTALVTMDANLPMDERITITYDDVDRLKGSSSRLAVGSTFSRQELLHLALMSSENRAAHALGRTYPGGGMPAFVQAMNMRATLLGMRDSHYVEPTGLNSANRSSARDLALLTKAAYNYPLIRTYTTYPGAQFEVAGQIRQFNNTNRLVHSNNWNIGLQKTGYISEAGRCVVMQSNIDGRNVIIVLLDSNNSNLRVQDAEAIRTWVQNNQGGRGQPGRTGLGVVAQAY